MTDQQPAPAENPFAALGNAINAAMSLTALRLLAGAALGAALAGDDEGVLAAVDGLDAEQSDAVITAASAVGYATARHRKTLLGDDQADEHAEPSAAVEQLRDQIADSVPNSIVGVGYVRRFLIADAVLPVVEATATAYRDEAREQRARADQAGRSAAAWEADAGRHLDNADYWWKRAETAERSLGASERNLAEQEALVSRMGGYLNAARDAIGAKNWPAVAADITALRTRTDQAERERDEARAEMLRLGALLGDACDRAEKAEAERARARTVAGNAEKALGEQIDRAIAAEERAEKAEAEAGRLGRGVRNAAKQQGD